MERSSPLAAMQPHCLPFGQFFAQQPAHQPRPAARHNGYGDGSFNFKDLSMSNGPPQDYFNLKPLRGSSPTASLAADLSQNCHIDQSPLPPTPRRSLFSTKLLEQIQTREILTTPPPPSSSPCPLDDPMDMSPLPHKLPCMLPPAQINVLEATPVQTPMPHAQDSSPAYVPESPLDGMGNKMGMADRRRPTFLRPCFARTKAHSTTALSIKSAGLEQRPAPFRFGAMLSNPSLPVLHQQTSILSLEEAFVESPQSAVFQSPAMPPPRPKSSSNRATSFLPPSNGSPVTSHVRKPNGTCPRPRKQFRRSLSMFQSPADVLNQQKAEQRAELPQLPAVMDIDDTAQLQLPHFFQHDDAIPRISKETMIDVLNGSFNGQFGKTLIIDCRFEYEYAGGHIENAINFNNKEELAARLFQENDHQKTLLIFHCEYSAHRAPIAARYIRHEDRGVNSYQYPKLSYPELYILDGGYSSFFKDHKLRCFPQNYVEMNAQEHKAACEIGLGRIKQQRTKLSRAKTFAFGQGELHLQDSPTAPPRPGSCTMMNTMDDSMDTCPPNFQLPTNRRTASY